MRFVHDMTAEEPRLKPWMLTAALLIFAVLGGGFVFIAGSMAKARDRADIVAYEAAVGPAMRALDRAIGQLEALEPRLAAASPAQRRRVARTQRPPLESARRSLIDLEVPDILRHVTAEQLNSINRTLGVITQLDRMVAGADPRGQAGVAFREILELARAHRSAARTKLSDLRCVAGLGCESG